MNAIINLFGKKATVNLKKPLDISIPMRADDTNPNAWYIPAPIIEPVRAGEFIGDVNEGGSVNFRNIQFNPHAHGTHTECVGHISAEEYYLNQEVKEFFFTAKLISIEPEKINNDRVITTNQIQRLWSTSEAEAIIIRTLPNNESKLSRQYSNTNPPYIEDSAMQYLVNNGVQHLLIDLPSVDREEDDGKLLAHRAFWDYPANTQRSKTITEFVYVPNEIEDGLYLLNLVFAPFENDASPSKPILYKPIYL